MFITKGDMPHENMWGTWLSAAKWLMPPSYAKTEFSSSESMLPKQAYRQSSRYKSGLRHYREQSLFSFYVHAPPNHTGYAEDSVFWDRDIDKRVQVWAPCIAPKQIASLSWGCIYCLLQGYWCDSVWEDCTRYMAYVLRCPKDTSCVQIAQALSMQGTPLALGDGTVALP